MAIATTLKEQPQPTERKESFEELDARLLAGAAARIRADVEEAQRRGIIDADGRWITSPPQDPLCIGCQSGESSGI